MNTLTVGEVIDLLRDYPEDMAVTAFTEGRAYPILSLSLISKDNDIPFDTVEFACGWVPCNMYDEDEEEWDE